MRDLNSDDTATPNRAVCVFWNVSSLLCWPGLRRHQSLNPSACHSRCSSRCAGVRSPTPPVCHSLKVATDLIDALSASPQGRGSAEGGGYCPVLLHSIPIPIPALGVPITQTLALGARSHQSSCFFANHHPAHNSHQDRRRGGVRQFMSTSLVPLSH